MRTSALIAVFMLSFLFIEDANGYETSDSGFYCNLDAPKGDLQNVTCVNETDINLIGGLIWPPSACLPQNNCFCDANNFCHYWIPAYMRIPDDYNNNMVDLWVNLGIRHGCAGSLNVDLVSPNKTRVRLSKVNHTLVDFCLTDQFETLPPPFFEYAPYTPIWVDNGTSLPSPWLENALLGTNDFNGTLGSFEGDRTSGTWRLNISDWGMGGDLLFGNVSYWAVTITMNLSTEIVPPTYSENTIDAVGVYDPNARSNFSVRWVDNANEMEHAYLESNFTQDEFENYSMAGVEIDDNDYVFNYSLVLPAGVFQYRYYGEDKAGNWNASDAYYVTVNRNFVNYSVELDGETAPETVSFYYGNTSIVSALKSFVEGRLLLYLNNIILDAGNFVTHNTKLAAGLNNYTIVYNGTQNYTHNETGLVINVSRAVPSFAIGFTPGNIHTYGIPTTLYCNMTSGDDGAFIALYLDASSVAWGYGNQSYTSILANGTHSVRCRYVESENFTESVVLGNALSITQAAPVLNFTLDGYESDITIPRCHSINATAIVSTEQGVVNISMRNATHEMNLTGGSGDAVHVLQVCDRAGSELNFTALYTESQNFSSATKTFFAFIDPVKPLFGSNNSDIQYSASADNFSVNFTITWSDNINISNVFLENNFNGTMLNETMYGSGFHYYNTSVRTGTYSYRFLANDTSDSWNSTGALAFSVSFSPSPSPATGCVTACGGGGGGGNTPTVTVTTTVTTTTSALVEISTTTSTSAKPAALVIQALRLGSLGGETVVDSVIDTDGDSITGMFTGTFLDGANAVIAAVSAGLFAFAAWAYLSNSGHPKRKR